MLMCVMRRDLFHVDVRLTLCSPVITRVFFTRARLIITNAKLKQHLAR